MPKRGVQRKPLPVLAIFQVLTSQDNQGTKVAYLGVAYAELLQSYLGVAYLLPFWAKPSSLIKRDSRGWSLPFQAPSLGAGCANKNSPVPSSFWYWTHQPGIAGHWASRWVIIALLIGRYPIICGSKHNIHLTWCGFQGMSDFLKSSKF